MESVAFPCLLSLSAVRVRKQQRAEDLSNRADVLSYPYTSSPLLVSVYSCISSASLGPQLGVSCNVTQVTHLEAACYAEEAEMPLLCSIDTYEKRTFRHYIHKIFTALIIFTHAPPLLPWRKL